MGFMHKTFPINAFLSQNETTEKGVNDYNCNEFNTLDTMMKRPISLILILSIASAALCPAKEYESRRPAEKERLFVSTAVEAKIQEVVNLLENEKLAWMFANCFPNTLDTTVHPVGDNDTFVYTGDIHAMWLRDSGAQVWPYLPLINEDPELKDLLKGVILRQFKCICIDPYANAFYKEEDKRGEWASDITDMKPGVHERKWEIDSHCYPIRLAYEYWKVSGDCSIFSDLWIETMENVLKTLRDIAPEKQLICLFGCGGDRDKTKRPEMAKVAEEFSDRIIVTSDNSRTERTEDIMEDIRKGFTPAGEAKAIFIADRKEAIRTAILTASEGATILLAGKGHETYQIIGKEKRHFDEKEIVEEIFANIKA